jgi:hypothetical protein
MSDSDSDSDADWSVFSDSDSDSDLSGVSTPRERAVQLVIRSRYTGPKNNHGQPDTTGTDEIGVMKYPITHRHYISYSGQWKNGKFNGHGTIAYNGGDTYTGGYRMGKKHGRGVYTFKGGDTYTGGYRMNKKHGRGVYTFNDGNVFAGEFINDEITTGTHRGHSVTFTGTFQNGQSYNGRFVFKNGDVFEGTRVQNDFNGRFRYSNGDIYYGRFDLSSGRELLYGYGELIVKSMPVNFTYKGYFKNGKRHGKGKIFLKGADGVEESYSAEFDNDVIIPGTNRPNPPKGLDSDDSESNGGARRKKTVCHRSRRKISGSKKRKST